MSELINNREYRKEVIKQVIAEIHQGKTVDEVKGKFEEAFAGVSATEITEVEQELISEGLPVEEVQNLCEIHAAVFKGSIQEIHKTVDETQQQGHPVQVFKLENRFIEDIVNNQVNPYAEKLPNSDSIEPLLKGLKNLYCIDTHYSRKENLFFPFMEKYGITAPPKVMWGVDDEIRTQLKEVTLKLEQNSRPLEQLKTQILETTERITEMIFKEENIMLPMLTEVLTQEEWKSIADDSEIGYIIDNVPEYKPVLPKQVEISEKPEADSGVITLPSGSFKIEELVNMLNALPVDITFVDKNDVVKYFSQGSERIFPRTKAVIGRNVANCHPPSSVNIVEDIVNDFKSGKKDSEDFWINMGERFVLIRYFAVRNNDGEYLGVLEFTQNIKPIQEIKGEKRLLD